MGWGGLGAFREHRDKEGNDTRSNSQAHSPSANFGGLCGRCLNTVEPTVAFLQLKYTRKGAPPVKAASTRLSINPLALPHHTAAASE